MNKCKKYKPVLCFFSYFRPVASVFSLSNSLLSLSFFLSLYISVAVDWLNCILRTDIKRIIKTSILRYSKLTFIVNNKSANLFWKNAQFLLFPLKFLKLRIKSKLNKWKNTKVKSEKVSRLNDPYIQ